MTEQMPLIRGTRYPIAHAQAFPLGARVVSDITPATTDPSDARAVRQRVDEQSQLPVWLVTVVDLASVSQREVSITVELLAAEGPQLQERREVEFTGLTVEPQAGGTETEPWTIWHYRALGLVSAPRPEEDTRPLPMALLLAEDAGGADESARTAGGAR